MFKCTRSKWKTCCLHLYGKISKHWFHTVHTHYLHIRWQLLYCLFMIRLCSGYSFSVYSHIVNWETVLQKQNITLLNHYSPFLPWWHIICVFLSLYFVFLSIHISFLIRYVAEICSVCVCVCGVVGCRRPDENWHICCVSLLAAAAETLSLTLEDRGLPGFTVCDQAVGCRVWPVSRFDWV